MTVIADLAGSVERFNLPAVPQNNLELSKYMYDLHQRAYGGEQGEYTVVYRFNNRLRTTGGTCQIFEAKKAIEVCLNCHIDHPLEFISTALHELAHAVDMSRRQTSDHSVYWEVIYAKGIRMCDLQEAVGVGRTHKHKALLAKRRKVMVDRFVCTNPNCKTCQSGVQYKLSNRAKARVKRGFLVVGCPKCKTPLVHKKVSNI